MRRTSLEIEKQIIDRYSKKDKISHLAILFNTDRKTIRKILRRNNSYIEKPKRKIWSLHQLKTIKKYYPIYGTLYCSEKLNLSKKIIGYIASQILKIKMSRNEPLKKFCSSCKTVQYIKHFPKAKNGRNGIHQYCRCCINSKRNLYVKNHTDLMKEAYKRHHNRYKYDLNFRIKKLLRIRTYKAIKLKNGKKSKKTMELLGCSVEFFKNYIESLFINGMSWKNYGKIWQIDHIEPCHKFDLTKEKNQKICFHYTNMRPLWTTTKIANNCGDFKSIGNLNRNRFTFFKS